MSRPRSSSLLLSSVVFVCGTRVSRLTDASVSTLVGFPMLKEVNLTNTTIHTATAKRRLEGAGKAKGEMRSA